MLLAVNVPLLYNISQGQRKNLTRKAEAVAFKAKTFKRKVKTKAKAGIL